MAEMMGQIVKKAYMNLRIDEMFDILNYLDKTKEQAIDFPPCLFELKTTLENVSEFQNMSF